MEEFSLFSILTLIGGLCLFLFGMDIMGKALERSAGNKLSKIIGKLTTNKFAGFLTGLGVTAVIQSSSATTVMVVGFVNSGLMNLKQAISVIMGANIGTTITAWILSLGGIDSGNAIVQMFKPMSFTPVLALLGLAFYMFAKHEKKKDIGTILLGFSVLMFGMDIMSDAVSGLKDVDAFKNLFLLFEEPVLGVVAGAVLTAIIQSSSASVGILQALTVTGKVTYGAALPIIMGQNIGTCVTAILSSFGTNRNAKRVAIAHLSFNVIGTAALLAVLYVVRGFFSMEILSLPADHMGIAVAHSFFNIICTILLFPMSSLLEKLVCRLVPESKGDEITTELDERLLATPAVALMTSRKYAVDMARGSVDALCKSIDSLFGYKKEIAAEVREKESLSDHYEDVIGDYLVKLSSHQIGESESAQAAELLHMIGDFERISDHAVNILESAEELKEKEQSFSGPAMAELKVLTDAVKNVANLALEAFEKDYAGNVVDIEALEEIIDRLKTKLRTNHIGRLQQGSCSIDVGFVWSDLLTNLERVSDHCSNIAECVLETSHNNFSMHESVRVMKAESDDYREKYSEYCKKYSVN